MFISTADSAGPQYFVVKSPVIKPLELVNLSYLQSVFTYQVNIIHDVLTKDEPSQSLLPTAPTYQIAPNVKQKITEFVQKLEPFAYLHNGWDGEESIAPSVSCLWQAVVNSYKLIAVGFPTPEPKVLSDGTLGIYWEDGLSYATIDFEEDGAHLWTASNGRDVKSGIWDSKTEAPPNLRSMDFEESSWTGQPLQMLR